MGEIIFPYDKIMAQAHPHPQPTCRLPPPYTPSFSSSLFSVPTSLKEPKTKRRNGPQDGKTTSRTYVKKLKLWSIDTSMKHRIYKDFPTELLIPTHATTSSKRKRRSRQTFSKVIPFTTPAQVIIVICVSFII